ncbi:MAG: hypothetical protein HQL32_07005, partial [Planctomycetes bacterium]|nr:hypothetical protein [Planctomycetota bacterium]
MFKLKELTLRAKLLSGMALIILTAFLSAGFGFTGSTIIINNTISVESSIYLALEKAEILTKIVRMTRDTVQLSYEDSNKSMLRDLDDYRKQFKDTIINIQQNTEDKQVQHILQDYQFFYHKSTIILKKQIEMDHLDNFGLEEVDLISMATNLIESINQYKYLKRAQLAHELSEIRKYSINFKQLFTLL